MKTFQFLKIVSLSMLLTASCFSEEELQENLAQAAMPSASIASLNQDEIERIAFASNSVAFSIYNQMKVKDENLVFSPYSLSAALNLVYPGAAGLTQAQMGRILQFRLPENILSKAFASLTDSLTSSSQRLSDDVFLNISNALWVQQGLKILPSFEKTMREDYKSAFKLTNFTGKTDQARVAINDWVRKETQGKISTLFEKDTIDQATRMVLVSTMFMRGKWQTPFNKEATKQTIFFPSQERTITVPMMTMTDSFPYLSEKDFSMIELPYESKKPNAPKLAMYILLPEETFGLPSLEARLNADLFSNLVKRLQRTQVLLSLPRFQISSSLSLKEPLMKLGLTEAFSNHANFSGINGEFNLKLDKVVQKTFISVDEKGTEAGVATGISMKLKSALMGSPKIFLADHPFLFIIADKSSNAILFMGKVSRPN